MVNPLHAASYADQAVQVVAPIRENVRIAKDTFRVRYECPTIAQRIVPGQFVMVRLSGLNDPLLGRPLALYDLVVDSAGTPWAIDLVYLAAGKMTRRLAELCAGQSCDVWGPLGNGFPLQQAQHLIMVAGGIGQTPFLAVAKEYLGQQSFRREFTSPSGPGRVTLCYGVRTADYLAGLDQFEAMGIDVRVSTDDGTCGHHGLVTDLLCPAIDETVGTAGIVCCGPEPMMRAVARIAHDRNVPCQVSLETPMACGMGICFTCVAKVVDAQGDWDYRRTCVDGPVFDSRCIAWD
jgi:dihydroorotate dehydrogenase electron transfer subunit